MWFETDDDIITEAEPTVAIASINAGLKPHLGPDTLHLSQFRNTFRNMPKKTTKSNILDKISIVLILASIFWPYYDVMTRTN